MSFAGETSAAIALIVSGAQTGGGNTTLTLPANSITLVGVTHVDGGVSG